MDLERERERELEKVKGLERGKDADRERLWGFKRKIDR